MRREPPDWSYVAECGGCNGEVEASVEDLEVDGFKISGHFFDGSDVCEDRVYFHCPRCSSLIFVPTECTTAYVRSQAKDPEYKRRSS